jgi:hypothetical protein
MKKMIRIGVALLQIEFWKAGDMIGAAFFSFGQLLIFVFVFKKVAMGGFSDSFILMKEKRNTLKQK